MIMKNNIKEYSHPDVDFLIIDESLNENRIPLQELFKLSTVGKLFLGGLAAWIVGRASALKIRGNKEDIDAVANAIMASKKFQEEMSKPGASLDSILEKLKIKNARGRTFSDRLGIPYPF